MAAWEECRACGHVNDHHADSYICIQNQRDDLRAKLGIANKAVEALRALVENSGKIGVEGNVLLRLLVMKAHWDDACAAISAWKQQRKIDPRCAGGLCTEDGPCQFHTAFPVEGK